MSLITGTLVSSLGGCVYDVVYFFACLVADFVVAWLEVKDMENLFAPVPLVDDAHRI